MASATLAIAAADCSKCEQGPCTKRAVCIDDECLYSFQPDGFSCNGGAGKCDRGSCTAPASGIERRAESTTPMINTDNGDMHLITENGAITLKAEDVIFSLAEKRVGDTILPASEFSIVSLQDSLKETLDESIAALEETTNTKLDNVQTALTTLEEGVNTKVKADLAAISGKLDALDDSVKKDVQTQLQSISDAADVAHTKADEADAAISTKVDSLEKSLETVGSGPKVYKMGTTAV